MHRDGLSRLVRIRCRVCESAETLPGETFDSGSLLGCFRNGEGTKARVMQELIIIDDELQLSMPSFVQDET